MAQVVVQGHSGPLLVHVLAVLAPVVILLIALLILLTVFTCIRHRLLKQRNARRQDNPLYPDDTELRPLLPYDPDVEFPREWLALVDVYGIVHGDH